MPESFDIRRFRGSKTTSSQYEAQLNRLKTKDQEVDCIEAAVRGAVRNISENNCRSFVIYGEPQSGKTEMMICLTGKLLDEGFDFVVHMLNDSVDLLTQNLGRFKNSGLAPSARNFSEILDPDYTLKGRKHVVFCKKNARDLEKLVDKKAGIGRAVVIDDEADYASPNSKVNSGTKTRINELIGKVIGRDGIYIGVTATPARLDLNNTFDNDSELWVNFHRSNNLLVIDRPRCDSCHQDSKRVGIQAYRADPSLCRRSNYGSRAAHRVQDNGVIPCLLKEAIDYFWRHPRRKRMKGLHGKPVQTGVKAQNQQDAPNTDADLGSFFRLLP
jgi:hypothetical protein